MTDIGGTFGNELIAANLHNGVGWNTATGELMFNSEVSEEDRAKIEALLAEHDLTKRLPKIQFFFLEFIGLFTAIEQAVIVGSADVQVRIFLLMVAGASVIDFTDPRISGGLDYLLSLLLLAPNRKATLLSGSAVS